MSETAFCRNVPLQIDGLDGLSVRPTRFGYFPPSPTGFRSFACEGNLRAETLEAAAKAHDETRAAMIGRMKAAIRAVQNRQPVDASVFDFDNALLYTLSAPDADRTTFLHCIAAYRPLLITRRNSHPDSARRIAASERVASLLPRLMTGSRDREAWAGYVDLIVDWRVPPAVRAFLDGANNAAGTMPAAPSPTAPAGTQLSLF